MQQRRTASLLTLLAAITSPIFAEPTTCKGQQFVGSTCASQQYASSFAASVDACCELCNSERGCAQWTYHKIARVCVRTQFSEGRRSGLFSRFAVCGVVGGTPTPPPGPPPTPPPGPPSPANASSRWAVIAAGSSGFMNYRHQADACHAYQIMKKSGVPEDHIILMMQDDVANSSENPFRGKLFNRPGNSSPDVYSGCKVDYRGRVVTAKLFLDVITGNAAGVPEGGKVLRTGPQDRVFMNFVDHGGVGIVAFPNGPVLHVSELSEGLKAMQKKRMFSELVFYMEACESGSMFPDVTSYGKIFAVTASNAKESSWGTYCGSAAVVDGINVGSCLGDLFSIAWMEDADLGMLGSETLKAQVRHVTFRTDKSHVMNFGDRSFENETIGRFELMSPDGLGVTTASSFDPGQATVDARDIPLKISLSAWETAAPGPNKAKAWERLQAVQRARAADTKLFGLIARGACRDSGPGCTVAVSTARHSLLDVECHRVLVRRVHEACPRRTHDNPGGWNDFNMQFSRILVNICERKAVLKKGTADLLKIVHEQCLIATQESLAERAAATAKGPNLEMLLA